MNPAEARKLLGGYASGILTPEEQKALFEAALEDQELFEALAEEQALREVLAAPGAKEQLLHALEQQPEYEEVMAAAAPMRPAMQMRTAAQPAAVPAAQRIRAWFQRPRIWVLSAAS